MSGRQLTDILRVVETCGSHELLLCPHVDIYIYTHTSRLQSCQTFGSPVSVTVAGGLLDKPVRCSGVADRSNSRFGHLTDEQPTPHFARSIRTSKVAPVKVGLQAPQVDTTFSLLDSTKNAKKEMAANRPN